MAVPDATADLALPGLDALGLGDRAAWKARARRLALPGGVAAVAAGAVFAFGGPMETFGDALARAFGADPRWVLAAIGFEILSFAGYVLLLWHVAGRNAPRIGVRASYQLTMAGAVATRILPTAGAGGAALTVVALRGAGLRDGGAARTLLAFLVVLYSVFLAAIAVAGGLIATGAVDAEGPLALSLVPGALAALAILAGARLGLRPAREPVTGTSHRAKVARGAALMGDGVRDAVAIIRARDLRLLGAPAWWAFDVAVLWAMFNALGTPPPLAVIVLGYFVGQVANTLPLPGAVAGGMVGILLAFGVEADLALAAVLAFRAIALWLPAPAGLLAMAGLRGTLAGWQREDAAGTAPGTPAPVRVHLPEPLAA